jgi:hypothetical protein
VHAKHNKDIIWEKEETIFSFIGKNHEVMSQQVTLICPLKEINSADFKNKKNKKMIPECLLTKNTLSRSLLNILYFLQVSEFIPI